LLDSDTVAALAVLKQADLTRGVDGGAAEGDDDGPDGNGFMAEADVSDAGQAGVDAADVDHDYQVEAEADE
jgi:hypothetical protein